MFYNAKTLRRQLGRRADQQRDAKNYVEAAALYEASLQVVELGPIHVQAGHMYKESLNLAEAARHYARAAEMMPDDADLAMQLGHLAKLGGRLEEAERHYRRAVELTPGNAAMEEELRSVERRRRLDEEADPIAPDPDDLGSEEHGGRDRQRGFLSPELLPIPRAKRLLAYEEEFVLTRMGSGQRTRFGDRPTLRGIDAIRGHIVTATPILAFDIYLDGGPIGRFPAREAPLRRAADPGKLRKYVLNAWIDVSAVPPGRHEIILHGVNFISDTREHVIWRRERVVVAEPASQDEFGYSDGVLSPVADPNRSLEEQINAAPSVLHPSSTRSFPAKLDTILVMRTDQLGDMVVSIPALRRLRQIAPVARIVGLLTAANADLARTLDLFDDIVIADFPDDREHRRRVMDQPTQLALRRQLATFDFDLAIDLAVSGVSNKLMTLSGAPYMIGFGLGGAQWMTLGIDIASHDIRSNTDFMEHSGRTRVLIEALGAWLDSGARVARRDDLDPAMLVSCGVVPGDAFALVHSGSRIAFSRFRHFPELAEALIRRRGLKVVYLSDDPAELDRLPEELVRSGDLVFIARKLDFDQFDALAHFCAVFVGNDSGPKHLASLRGAKVVSVHSARTNWKEWGQELGGIIVSRKVPCAGCSIHHEPEECGKDFACVSHIGMEEVYGAVEMLLDGGPEQSKD